MIESGRNQTQSPVEQELAGGGFQQVLAAHDFSDTHGGVINGHSKMVRGHVIVPPDDKITEIFSSHELLTTAPAIHERDDFAIQHAEAPINFGCRLNVASCKLD